MVLLWQEKVTARAVDRKYFEATSSHEPLVQLQNNFTEMFLIMHSTAMPKRLSSPELNGPQKCLK